MKGLIFIMVASCISCTTTVRKYNACNFFKPYIVSDSILFNSPGLASDGQFRHVRIIDSKINNSEIDKSPNFYGLFKGIDLKNDTFSILAFKTTIPKDELMHYSSTDELSIRLFRSLECFDFNSSINIVGNINPHYPIVTGELRIVVKD